MKKISILSLLILPISSVFGMDLPRPTLPKRSTYQPNALLQQLRSDLEDLQEIQNEINTTDYQIFRQDCDLLKAQATHAGYQKIAHAVETLNMQVHNRLTYQQTMKPRQLFN